MITLYVTSSTHSSRKARHWLANHHLPFAQRNLLSDPLTFREFLQLLSLTDNGTSDLLTTRSGAYQEYQNQLSAGMTIQQLFVLVRHHPDLLHCPLIADKRRLQAGYNSEDIRQFLPRQVRIAALVRARLASEVA